MSPSKSLARRPRQRQYFTLEEANAMLPLVRAIVADIVRLSREVSERRQRLALLFDGKSGNPHDPYQQELVQVERDLQKDAIQLREYFEELTALGLEPKDGLEGLVDFPAILDGRRVYLCWKLGEPSVMFCHGLDEGFAGRKPLPASARFESQFPAEDAPFGGDASRN